MTFAAHNVVDEFSPEVEKLTNTLKLCVRGGSQTHACANDLASYAAYFRLRAEPESELPFH